MSLKSISSLMLSFMVVACAMTQTPVNVADSQKGAAATHDNQLSPAQAGSTALTPSGVPGSVSVRDLRPTETPIAKGPVQALTLVDLHAMAQAIRKNPASRKNYLGQNLQGKARFVKTAKGNPNAMVADVRVNGLGEVSLWCRNIVGATPIVPVGRVTSFSGQFTGAVYTSEDFSHDVNLKDCRFHE
jgi:hypothetical protein